MAGPEIKKSGLIFRFFFPVKTRPLFDKPTICAKCMEYLPNLPNIYHEIYGFYVKDSIHSRPSLGSAFEAMKLPSAHGWCGRTTAPSWRRTGPRWSGVQDTGDVINVYKSEEELVQGWFQGPLIIWPNYNISPASFLPCTGPAASTTQCTPSWVCRLVQKTSLLSSVSSIRGHRFNPANLPCWCFCSRSWCRGVLKKLMCAKLMCERCEWSNLCVPVVL